MWKDLHSIAWPAGAFKNGDYCKNTFQKRAAKTKMSSKSIQTVGQW